MDFILRLLLTLNIGISSLITKLQEATPTPVQTQVQTTKNNTFSSLNRILVGHQEGVKYRINASTGRLSSLSSQDKPFPLVGFDFSTSCGHASRGSFTKKVSIGR